MAITHLQPTQAEQKLIDATRDGLKVSYEDDLEPERVLRGEVIAALAAGWRADWTAPRGVRIEGASIVGPIDLAGATIDSELALVACQLAEPISLEDAVTRTIRLERSTLGPFNAQRARFRGSVYLDGLKSRGELRLWDSRIEGSLGLRNAELTNPGARAFDGGRMKVEGAVRLDWLHVEGETFLAGAEIRGELVATHAVLVNPGGCAFDAENLEIEGPLLLKGLTAWGEIRLNYARLGSTLELHGAWLSSPSASSPALNAFGLEARGKIFLGEGFVCIGQIDFRAAKLGAILQLAHATVLHPHRIAFDAAGAEIGVVAGFYWTLFRGLVTLFDSSAGAFECEDSILENPKARALDASSISVSGQTLFRRNYCRGAVSFAAADLNGDLDLAEAEFHDPLILARARIRGALNCERAVFKGAGERIVHATGLTVGGTLYWRNLAVRPDGIVELAGAHVGQLDDDEKSWPRGLRLDGFTYDSFARSAPLGKARLRWLRDFAEFSPQAYEQAVQVLRRMGDEHGARRIAWAKQEDLGRRGGLRLPARIWSSLLGWTLGHGYQVWRSALLLLALFALGAFVFHRADVRGAMLPADPKAQALDLPPFHPLAYSLDAGLPIIDLHQERYWLPRAPGPAARPYRIYLWWHIALGWLFTSLMVTGLTGLIKKD